MWLRVCLATHKPYRDNTVLGGMKLIGTDFDPRNWTSVGHLNETLAMKMQCKREHYPVKRARYARSIRSLTIYYRYPRQEM